MKASPNTVQPSAAISPFAAWGAACRAAGHAVDLIDGTPAERAAFDRAARTYRRRLARTRRPRHAGGRGGERRPAPRRSSSSSRTASADPGSDPDEAEPASRRHLTLVVHDGPLPPRPRPIRYAIAALVRELAA